MILWRGIHKLQEEMAELGEVLGKLAVVPVGRHWDEDEGKPPLRDRLIMEMADVRAAIEYFTNTNLTSDEAVLIDQRRWRKLRRFEIWQLTGVVQQLDGHQLDKLKVLAQNPGDHAQELQETIRRMKQILENL